MIDYDYDEYEDDDEEYDDEEEYEEDDDAYEDDEETFEPDEDIGDEGESLAVPEPDPFIPELLTDISGYVGAVRVVKTGESYVDVELDFADINGLAGFEVRVTPT
jgi:hypothetical protein